MCQMSLNQRESATFHLTHVSNVIHTINTLFPETERIIATLQNGRKCMLRVLLYSFEWDIHDFCDFHEVCGIVLPMQV